MRSDVFLKAINSIDAFVFFISSDVEGEFGGIVTLWNPTLFYGTLIHSTKKILIDKMRDLKSHLRRFLINVYVPNARSP